MTPDLGPTLTALARQQAGLLTRRQLREQQISRAQLRWRLGRQWQLVLPQVVDVQPSGPVTGSRQLVAAMLEVGERGIVTGHRACLWHGLGTARGNRPVVALVPRQQASRTAGFVRVVATSRMDAQPLVRGPLRIASAPRAVVDAAREVDMLDAAAAVVIEAVQRRLVSVEDLEHEVEAGPQRGSRVVRQAVRLARSGSWSLPEADALALCATSDVLPRAWPNPELQTLAGESLLSPDLWLDDVGIAIMIHSRTYHQRDVDWEVTVERDGGLTEHGIIVVSFTGTAARQRPQQTLRRIERVYQRALTSGRARPPVRMIPRAFGLVS